jgi:hypothetical protein
MHTRSTSHRAARGLTLTAFCASLPQAAFAHAFDERYDLPAPLFHFVLGATAAVALSFAVTALFARRPAPAGDYARTTFAVGAVMPIACAALRVLSVGLLALTLAAGFHGTRDPMMNLAPTLVWIVWWVGLSLFVALIGNVWPAVDPWRTIFDALDRAARLLGRRKGFVAGAPYPRSLAVWPAVALLLFIGWFEVVYPEGAEPRRIATALLVWTVVGVTGRALFGRDQWERNADVFSIYFDTLGRFAPVAFLPENRRVELRPYGRALVTSESASAAMTAFIVAMLAIVLFDGLLSGETWWSAQASVMRAVPSVADARGALGGAVGLVTLWAIFLGAYALACAIAARSARGLHTGKLMRVFAYTLVPIAVAYNVAHNYSNLLIQGQHAIALVSDPLGQRWNLFGTAGYRANMRVVDPRTTWYVAITAIVAGHVVSVWLAHRVALRTLGSRGRAVLACVPLTALMLAYTAVSLYIIAEPMTKFSPPSAEPVSVPD